MKINSKNERDYYYVPIVVGEKDWFLFVVDCSNATVWVIDTREGRDKLPVCTLSDPFVKCLTEVLHRDWTVTNVKCVPECENASDSAALMCLNLFAFASNRERANVSCQQLDNIFAYRPTREFLKRVRNFIGGVVYRYMHETE